MISELIRSTQVQDVMTKNVITVHENDAFHIVWEKFHTFKIRHLPVVNDAGQVTGLITQRQLYRISSPRHLEDDTWYYDKDMLDNFILKNVMLQEPHMLGPEATLEEAMRRMVESGLGCIPIVDKYRLPLGILTRIDVMKFFLNHA